MRRVAWWIAMALLLSLLGTTQTVAMGGGGGGDEGEEGEGEGGGDAAGIASEADNYYHVGPTTDVNQALLYCLDNQQQGLAPIRITQPQQVELLNILRYTRVAPEDESSNSPPNTDHRIW